jgi:hypothetical protein
MTGLLERVALGPAAYPRARRSAGRTEGDSAVGGDHGRDQLADPVEARAAAGAGAAVVAHRLLVVGARADGVEDLPLGDPMADARVHAWGLLGRLRVDCSLAD